MARDLLAPTLRSHGFNNAANSTPHWRHDAITEKAWELYVASNGDAFLDINGKPFVAPKMLTKKREYREPA